MKVAAKARERRVIRRLDSRGLKGLGQALVRLRGVQIAGRWELGSLFAVGAEGAVFLVHDVWDSSQPMRVAKTALLPYHKPFELSFDEVRRRRAMLREESRRLEASASKYMPEFLGLHEFQNPLLDAERGGEFALSEPVFVMERLPGFDLDFWLARVHSSSVPRAIVRRNVDHVAIVVLRGLWDLHERGYFYCDLRPGNIRIRGRSEHRVRLMDAGSLVPREDKSGGFPHVPAYLPPELFWRAEEQGPDALVPSLEIQTVMAGRTLFEVATGRVPTPGQPVDVSLLKGDTVSPEVAETIEGLCAGNFADVFQALKFLAKRTSRGKITSGSRTKPAPSTEAVPAAVAAAPVVTPVAAPAPAAPAAPRRAPAKREAPIREPEPELQPAMAESTAPPFRDLASALAAARATFKPPVLERAARQDAQEQSPIAAAFAAADAASETRRSRAAPSARASSPRTLAPVEGRLPTVDEILPPSRPRPWWRRLFPRF